MAKLAVEIDPRGAQSGARVVKREMADINRSAERVDKSTARMGKTANDNLTKMARGASLVGAGWKSLIGLATGMAMSIVTAFSVQPLFAFKDALAEVSTLVNTATFDMRGLEQASLDQLATFGGSAAGQVKAYYQIISAGASDAASATEMLTAANKLAIGGVTDVTTAADGLTSIVNAYGSKVEGATAVSDALFVAMRAGKTTIGELSSSLGKVAPLAAQTGVSFDELVASISALTKGGIATTEAVTGVRAILAAVAKPSKEASDMAHQLGLEFNSAALESKGFAGFIQDLVVKTGGSTDALSQLFGGVEALVPVMALSGQAGKDFTAILEQMGVKAGSTEEAFNKMANSPGFQAGRIWASLQAEVLKTSSALSGPLVTSLKFVADNMDTLASLIKIAGVALLVAFGPQILVAIGAGFIGMINIMVGGLVVLKAAILSNPIGVLATLAAAAGMTIYEFSTSTDEAAASLANLAAQAAPLGQLEGMVSEVEGIQRAYTAAIAGTASGQTAATSSIVADTTREFEAKKSLLELELKRQQALVGIKQAELGAAQSALRSDMQSSVLGLDTSGFSDPRIGNYVRNPVTATATDALMRAADASAARDAVQRLRAEVDLTSISTDKLAEALSTTFSDIEGGTGAVTELGTAATDTGKKLKGAADSDPWKGLRKAVKETKEEISFAQSTAKGFLSDLRQGLKNGESFWQSFGNAAMNVLDKIIDKIEDQLINAIFSVRSAGSGMGGGGGGGLFGGIFGMIGKLFGFAQGGVLQHSRVSAFATGGVVSKPTLFPMANGAGLMGEAGPEAIMPLQRAPNGDLGVRMSGGGQLQTVRVLVESVASVDEDGNWHNRVEKISQQKVDTAAPQIVKAANSQVLPTVGRYQNEKAGGDWR